MQRVRDPEMFPAFSGAGGPVPSWPPSGRRGRCGFFGRVLGMQSRHVSGPELRCGPAPCSSRCWGLAWREGHAVCCAPKRVSALQTSAGLERYYSVLALSFACNACSVWASPAHHRICPISLPPRKGRREIDVAF